MVQEQSDGSIGAVRSAVSATAEILRAAKENPDAAKAGQTAAKSLSVLSTSLYNMLMPLRVLNYGAAKVESYFATKFGEELGAKLADVPAEHIVEPKTFIAGPVIQGIADTVEEPDLRGMYTSLLARAMTDETADEAHPSYAEIIKQLAPREVPLMQAVMLRKIVPAVSLQGMLTDGGWVTYEQHIVPIFVMPQGEEGYNAAAVLSGARSIENWERLGLIEVNYTNFMTAPDAYAWVEDRPEYVHRKAALPPEQTLNHTKGFIRPTTFGYAFAEAVGIPTSVSP